jgi:hypothetical protein
MCEQTTLRTCRKCKQNLHQIDYETYYCLSCDEPPNLVSDLLSGVDWVEDTSEVAQECLKACLREAQSIVRRYH